MINCFCIAMSLLCCYSLPFNKDRDKRDNETNYIKQFALVPKEISFVDCDELVDDSEK